MDCTWTETFVWLVFSSKSESWKEINSRLKFGQVESHLLREAFIECGWSLVKPTRWCNILGLLIGIISNFGLKEQGVGTVTKKQRGERSDLRTVTCSSEASKDLKEENISECKSVCLCSSFLLGSPSWTKAGRVIYMVCSDQFLRAQSSKELWKFRFRPGGKHKIPSTGRKSGKE